MIIEDERFAHEELEQIESAISRRLQEKPVAKRDRLNRDHDIANLLKRAQEVSSRLSRYYTDEEKNIRKEAQSHVIDVRDLQRLNDSFFAGIKAIRDHHSKYPGEAREDLEAQYSKKEPRDENGNRVDTYVDNIFTGEEAFGRYMDLESYHHMFINLPDARHPSYVQYLSQFDKFTPPQNTVKRSNKLREQYFQYVSELANYLDSFMRRIRPLENFGRLFELWEQEFDDAWAKDKIEGWENEMASDSNPGTNTTEPQDPLYCDICAKQFTNENVFKAHFTARKHIKNAETRKENGANGEQIADSANKLRMQERAVAEREFRIQKLVGAMKSERSDTLAWVERKLGMTDKERQEEMSALLAEAEPEIQEDDDKDGDDGEEKIYNPLKLPIAWDGKPIPYWLYKLHGLGVEHSCQICGNYVYMGRRAFEKHFSEQRHAWGLKCLGINNTSMFREITSIAEAQKLAEKINADKNTQKKQTENVVQMEDAEGNVMPEKVYFDLQKQGLI